MSLTRQLVLLVFLAAVGGLGYLVYLERPAGEDTAAAPSPAAAGGSGARAVAVEAAVAAERVLERRVEAVGTTRALQSVDIVPLDDGRIVELNITPGMQIDEGDIIARLDPMIEQATLNEYEAQAEERRAALDRSMTLRQSNASTVSQAAVETLRAELSVAEAAVERARYNLSNRTVRAPFSGVLGISSVDLGARVETSTVLTTLDDLSEVEIEFRLPETVYGQIHQGQRIHAQSAAFPSRTFVGTVAAVDSRIDSVSRAFRVRARLPNDDRALPVGMFMRLDLALDDRRAVVVPEEALVVEGGTSQIYLVQNDTAVRREIRTGLRRNGVVEVLEGVAAGDLVVSRGIQSVRDGGPVRVIGRTPLPGTPTEVETPAVPAAAITPGRPEAAASPAGSRT
ncbi:secretion protein HlyD [Stappia sp. 22II-S9-Z10]|nr:secretion protein HlyD [Stappia sp. 22II-S9-Z10]